MRILVDGMRGLGDNIYQLGFVRSLAAQGHEVTMCTPWPELYADVPDVKFQRIHTSLRTQARNISRIPVDVWSRETQFDKRLSIHYAAASNIPDDMARMFGVAPIWGLPKFERKVVKDKPYVVVRPPTVRKEWVNESRNPRPEYVNQVAEWLSDRFHIISVADLKEGQEWLIGDAPKSDEQYNRGELSMPELFGLCQGAAAIVGGIGWALPFAISNGTPAFIIPGGNGGYNHPEKLANHTMDLSKIKMPLPDNMCLCTQSTHNCNKLISDLEGQFNEWQSVL